MTEREINIKCWEELTCWPKQHDWSSSQMLTDFDCFAHQWRKLVALSSKEQSLQAVQKIKKCIFSSFSFDRRGKYNNSLD